MPEVQTSLKKGDRIKDNDYRSPNRVLCIVDFATWMSYQVSVRKGTGTNQCTSREQYAIAEDSSGRRVYIRLDRIHTDGKPRKSGFDLLRRKA